MKNKAIFFDRDGVVNYRIVGEYIKTIDEFHFIPDFFSLFSYIKEREFIAILITNQQGIGRGVMNEAQLNKIHSYMQKILIKKTGSGFDDIFYCPELSSANSFRRKPNPGMLLEAMEKWQIDPNKSWMVGDRVSDFLAGKNAGIKTVIANCLVEPNEIAADFVGYNLIDVLEFFKGNEALL